ncbi:MAG: hypothetical protein B7X85_05535 [Thiotrichales bacterium 17-46-47]|nr:MAG: hypothetical protein B7X85_05535 [Thiotrichales bacterium 17-46-47]
MLHLPLRYEDRTQLTPADDCQAGKLVQLEGIISRSQEVPARRPIHLLSLQTQGLLIQLKFLNYQKWSHTLPKVGQSVRVFGQLRSDMHGQLELLHPTMTRLDAHKPNPLPDRLTAVYPSVGTLKQALMRKAIADALARLSQQPPSELLHQTQITLIEALKAVHLAKPGDAVALSTGQHPAIQRLASLGRTDRTTAASKAGPSCLCTKRSTSISGTDIVSNAIN